MVAARETTVVWNAEFKCRLRMMIKLPADRIGEGTHSPWGSLLVCRRRIRPIHTAIAVIQRLAPLEQSRLQMYLSRRIIAEGS